MLIIKTEEDRERCTSCYGNRTIVLSMEEVLALFSGATLGDPNFNEYGVFIRLEGSVFRRLVSYFEKLGPTESNRTDEIKYVVVDERVPYEYKIDGLDGCVCGEILVPPNATDQYIRKLIMDDLKILYRKA